MGHADWARLTSWLAHQGGPRVTISWSELNGVVGGLPASAVDHYPQWWHGDRPNTRAWRAAGYEMESVALGKSVTFRRSQAAVVAPRSTSSVQQREPARETHTGKTLAGLPDEDPRQAMIIFQCSADKAKGGTPMSVPSPPGWPAGLEAARQQIAAPARLTVAELMPAWKRYTGTFYKTCQPTLARAVAEDAKLVIVSGGYGVVTATEPIGWYDKIFKLSDWPPGCLQNALLDRATRSDAHSVIAFTSATTDYAKLIHKTPWARLKRPVYLVTGQTSGGGAMVKVPKTLGQAFSAFWNLEPEAFPGDISVERIA